MSVSTSILRAATTLYPFNTPRASILDRLPAIPINYGEISGKRGLRYADYWKSDDVVCRNLFWFGEFEPWINSALRRLALPGTVAMDIGANIGATALVLAKAVGPKGRVICFEPIPANALMLRKNLAANRLNHAEVEQIALSNRSGTARMAIPKDQAGMSQIIEGDEKDSIEVKCHTFDEWIKRYPDLRISVCKIDVEGHEDSVFAGMANSLDRISSFVFEKHNATALDPVFSMLANSGFKIFRIEKGLLRTYFPSLADAGVARATVDFVAVRPDAAHLLT